MNNAYAIVGLSVNYAKSPTKDAFWDNIIGNKQCMKAVDFEINSKKFVVDSKSKLADTVYNTNYGSINKSIYDSEHDILLEQVTDALDDAKCSIKSREKTAIINASLSFPSKTLGRVMNQRHLDSINRVAGNNICREKLFDIDDISDDNIDALKELEFQDPASYVAIKLGLKSGQYSLDAACASSLYTIHLAKHYLDSGKAEQVVCSSCSYADPLFVLTGFSVFGALPMSHENGGRTMPFDSETKGLNPGEGCAAVVLKRLSDAVAAGDHIYATVIGSNVNNAGRGAPLSPDIPSQIKCLDTGVPPEKVKYVECHATGTVLGDAAEIKTLATHFKDSFPRIGSSKGNFGHTLTSAGFAGLTKLLLSFSNGVIPPTPISHTCDEHVVTEPLNWTELTPHNTPKCAGLSAFGFGGTNAHLVLEEHDGAVPTKNTPLTMNPMKIVGMDCAFGSCADIDSFERTLYDSGHTACKYPQNKISFREEVGDLYGCFMRDIMIDYKRLKLPMTIRDKLTESHLLAMSVMDKSILDSGLKKGGNVAVLVGLGTDMVLYKHVTRVLLSTMLSDEIDDETMDHIKQFTENNLTATSYTSCIGNLIATRVSALWNFTGPSFSVTECENSVHRCMELAQMMISSGEVDAVVVSGIDMNSCEDSVYLKNYTNTESTPRMYLDSEFKHDFIGEGAGSVVVTADTFRSEKTYARIETIESSSNVKTCLNKVYGATDVSDIGLVEVTGSSVSGHAEITELIETFRGSKSKVGLTSVATTVGNTGYASGIASIIKSALCLYHRYIPGNDGWRNPRKEYDVHDHPFFVPRETIPWVMNESKDRKVAINGMSRTHTCFHMVLSDHHRDHCKENMASLDPSAPGLFAVSGNSERELKNRLEGALDINMYVLVKHTQDVHSGFDVRGESLYIEKDTYRAVIVTTAGGKNAEIQRILAKVSKTFSSGKTYKSISGSIFEPNPMSSSKIAFVYGDTTTPYYDYGKDIFRVFPDQHDEMSKKCPDAWMSCGGIVRNRTLYDTDYNLFINTYDENIMDKLHCGMYYSIINANILMNEMNVCPDSYLGLSLGEICGMLAHSQKNLDVAMKTFDKLNASDTFSKNIGNEFRVLRKLWDVNDTVLSNEFFQTYGVVHASDEVERMLKQSNHSGVFHTIISDDNNSVICGKPSECLTFFKENQITYIPTTSTIFAHSKTIECEHESLCEIHSDLLFPSLALYSSNISLQSNMSGAGGMTAGEYCTDLICSKADFRIPVKHAFADGHGIFIECGASIYRTSAIQSILRNEKHVAVPFDTAQTKPWNCLVKLSTRLISNHVNVRLPFHKKLFDFPESEEKARLKQKFIKVHSVNQKSVEMDDSVKGKLRSLNGLNVPHALYKMPSESKSKQTAPIEQAGPWESRETGFVRPETFLTPKLDSKGVEVLMDDADLLEFAEGKIGNVFGPEFDVIDTYEKRVMLPKKDYLLVSRVTKLDATIDHDVSKFKPATCTTEYDLPINGWSSQGGDIPWAIMVESGQCDLLLISYMGVDFICKGKRAYRLLDTTLTFFESAKEGDVLRYDISINSFAKQGDILLFFFSYNCYVGDKLIIEMRNGCAGFFTEEELADGKGVIITEKELAKRAKIQKRDIGEFNKGMCDKTSFSEDDMQALCERKWEAVMGENYRGLVKSYAAKRILMIDRISHIIPSGGVHGLGVIIGEKILDPAHWYFPCHFRDDSVMAGSLVCEGCSQLLRLYAVYLGLHTDIDKFRFMPLKGQKQKVRCRGQISPHVGKLVYHLEVTDIGYRDGCPYIKADVNIIDVDYDKGQTFDLDEMDLYGKGNQEKRIVVDFKDICIQVVPGDGTEDPWEKPVESTQVVQEKREQCFRPFKVTKSVFGHEELSEFARGDISKCLGKSFQCIDSIPSFRMPNTELMLTSRITGITGKQFDFSSANVAKTSVVAEFDMPGNAWFYAENPHLGENSTPMFIIQEIALQPCGFLSQWIGSHLLCKTDGKVCPMLFRNLDATAKLEENVCLKNKTVVIEARLTKHNKMKHMIVQKYEFVCKVGGKTVYTGKTSFGWFTPESMAAYKGIDNGKLDLSYEKDFQFFKQDQVQWYTKRSNRLQFFNDNDIYINESRNEIRGRKTVDLKSWFFSCHFWRDPVMPGSLGVESMYELLEIYCMNERKDKTLRFEHNVGEVEWKYRGQLTGKSKHMDTQVIVREFTENTIVADAYLYVDHMRVYEVLGIGLRIVGNGAKVTTDPIVCACDVDIAADSDVPDIPIYTHPLALVDGNPTPSFVPSKHEPRAVQFVPFPDNPLDANNDPDTAPFNWYNLAEFTLGKVSKCFGPQYEVFDESTTSRMPNSDLQLVTRVPEITGVRGAIKGGEYVVAEFDVPEDAWFLKKNTHDGLMPYSILMEIALQPCGFLTAYLGSPFLLGQSNLMFRNLNASVTYVDNSIDVRGKTLVDKCVLKSSNKLGNMVVQSFEFELSCDGVVFYKGETTFGWFLPQDMITQKGLDRGKEKDPWFVESGVNAKDINLGSVYSDTGMKPRDDQLVLMDSAKYSSGGGKHSKGYMYGFKTVNPVDWFFSCHFWLDPVMPGSLGVEAYVHLLECYCIEAGIVSKFKKPRFKHLPGKCGWKYRGQLTAAQKSMGVELHVKSVQEVDGDSGKEYHVVGDGYVFVEKLRMYGIEGLGCVVCEDNVESEEVCEEVCEKMSYDTSSSADNVAAALKNLAPITIGDHRIKACKASDFGSKEFMEQHGVEYPMYAGAMAKGIASAELVIQMGKNKMLASFGAGGLPLDVVKQGLTKIQDALPDGPYAVNLIHSPFDESLERGNVNLFLEQGITTVEASAFMTLTEHIVRYRVAGLSRKNGAIVIGNKVIGKVSRTELATMFMEPAPEKFLKTLLDKGQITEEQAEIARSVPMADDIAVEADSGGHTDNRTLHVLLPMMVRLRNKIQAKYRYKTPIRVGGGGGIGCPEAVYGAFAMGADFVVTGTINQMSSQAGTCDKVRKMLSEASYSDVTMAPAADMFDQGVELQVLKKGTFFPQKAKKLFELYKEYGDFEKVPKATLAMVEKQIFRNPISQIWKETKEFYIHRLNDKNKVDKAEKNPKTKMSMMCRWYLGKSSRWANTGETDRATDFQIWCGPAIGAFNQFISASYLDPRVAGKYPDVDSINKELFKGACYLKMYNRLIEVVPGMAYELSSCYEPTE